MRTLTIILSLTLLFSPVLQAKEKGSDIDKQLIRYAPKTKIFSYNPLYPASIKKENKCDTLQVKSQIDKSGFVIDVQILQSTGTNILDSTAIKTAYKYRYMPAYSEGKPITCWINETIIFDTLNNLIIGEIQSEIIEFVIPEYPRLAYQAGIEGRVFLKALIDSTGKVITVNIHKSSGTKDFDEVAAESGYGNKFKRATTDENKVAMWFIYQINFVNDYKYPVIDKY